MEYAKIIGAIKRIQRCWKRYLAKWNRWNQVQRQINAARMIQKNWKASRWVRIMNLLGKKRKHTKAAIVQKYIKGYQSRKH